MCDLFQREACCLSKQRPDVTSTAFTPELDAGGLKKYTQALRNTSE